ncbi:MAG: Gfo/Idh/MocA family oxidoreductase, partial [Bacteroidales bacterium]|nr:Gfo/Idh/MocA family oxidoreductase [Bacteroidales bacterium]
FIGFGFRGEQLARATQEGDLNIENRGISDIYNSRLEKGVALAGKNAKGYKHYKELLASDDIDAVMIASPDHWHAKMAIDAANAGKHIYLEKCMTRTVGEAIDLRDAVKKSKVVFQLGHQGRQRDLNLKAKELIEKGTLGKITLIETTTNRNDPFAAWVWPVHENAGKHSIDWDLFQETAPEKVSFNPERFFRWRCYWAYGTGMAGDLLTHEFDTVNSILNLGIPHSANASGGIYFYNDGREVPDVFHATYEYPDRKLTLLYSGTLANGIPRGTLIMGHDASLELGRSLTVWADKQSTKYRSRIEAGIINPSTPIVRYNMDRGDVDAISSATSKYFADRGLVHTYREGQMVNTTNLHIAEWLNCIRYGGETSCNIDQGFQEAISAHMATASYQDGRRVQWDHINEKII